MTTENFSIHFKVFEKNVLDIKNVFFECIGVASLLA